MNLPMGPVPMGSRKNIEIKTEKNKFSPEWLALEYCCEPTLGLYCFCCFGLFQATRPFCPCYAPQLEPCCVTRVLIGLTRVLWVVGGLIHALANLPTSSG